MNFDIKNTSKTRIVCSVKLDETEVVTFAQSLADNMSGNEIIQCSALCNLQYALTFRCAFDSVRLLVTVGLINAEELKELPSEVLVCLDVIRPFYLLFLPESKKVISSLKRASDLAYSCLSSNTVVTKIDAYTQQEWDLR